MIIKLHRAGRSFKGVTRYLTHDVKAGSSDRVAWTHTLNLANDDVPSAVDEMFWTFRSADLLKREAGISTGGSKLQKPVKHFSLSWPHGISPTKEHMIETIRAYMDHMGWTDRQAILVAHNDTKHSHAHVVMNSVSPEDGRAARSSHDWRKTEQFALGYEREHGQIHCAQRLKEPESRDPTPTRDAWQRFKKTEIAFERAEVERLIKMPDYFARHDEKGMNSREWDALKAYQKEQREKFFIDGKSAFRAVRNAAFREVREEFRGQWNAYYAALRGGHSKASLAETKIALTAAQNKALDERRQLVCEQLREQRDQAYQAILAQQRFDRTELGLRQQQGLRTYPLFDVIYSVPEPVNAPRKADEKQIRQSEWQIPTANPAVKPERERGFDRAANAAIDPYASNDHSAPRRSDAVRRNAAPATQCETADAFGRETRGGRKTDAFKRVEPSPTVALEMTDTASEKARATKAREMTDQAVAKGREGEGAALRASWNKRRRYRE